MNDQQYIEVSKSFFVDPAYKAALGELGLNSADDVFSFNAGTNLVKNNLAGYRTRTQFDINSPATTLFLKRYVTPPALTQLKNWVTHRKRISFGYCDFQHTSKLASFGINTPKTISYGQQWGLLFEKRSFAISEKIPNAKSLERQLPDCFNSPATPENLKLRRRFIVELAAFIKKFHEYGYCHRDLYLAHIFLDENGQFYLIDLARCFKPVLLGSRFRMKDIAQLYYSAPRSFFSRTDRMRFYLELVGKRKLTKKDKAFIRRVGGKARRMARHDVKHGRVVPFLT